MIKRILRCLPDRSMAQPECRDKELIRMMHGGIGNVEVQVWIG